jgi:hypothetical protein
MQKKLSLIILRDDGKYLHSYAKNKNKKTKKRKRNSNEKSQKNRGQSKPNGLISVPFCRKCKKKHEKQGENT